MGVLQSCRQFLGDFAQASIHLQGDVPDEQQLILLTDGDPPIPQVLLSSFEMCWRDDGSLTFAFVLAPSSVEADTLERSHSIFPACCPVSLQWCPGGGEAIHSEAIAQDLGHFCHIPILGIRVVHHDDHLADLKLHAFLVFSGD